MRVLKEIPIITFSLWCTRLLVCRYGQKVTVIKPGVHRTLTPCRTLDVGPRLERGSGSGIGNKAIIISAKQQSHTEEYGIVHGSSNHIRNNMKEYGVLHEE